MVDKVVYSFWSKPMNSDNVGFNSEEAFANCLKLSVFYSKKHFKEVQMVTDSNGLRILKKWNIDVYFDDIRLDFDDVLKDVSINNWALGKIYACKIQDKPFIHIDNDVILFNKLSDIILKSECCFQNYEKNYGYYDNLLSSISDKEFKPEYIDTNINIALNCGVILFNNLSILNKWWLDALKCVDELSNLNLDNINLLFEQTYIYWLLISNKINITVLTDFDEKSKNDDYISDDYAKRIGYTHLISNSKRDPKTEEKIKNRLIKENLFKISIITTCKGRLEYLKKTLDSWINQKYENYEIIVVSYNDYSVSNFINKINNNKIKLVDFKDDNEYFNLSHARNIGALSSINSDFLIFMDSDMFMCSDFFIIDNVKKMKTNKYIIGNINNIMLFDLYE